MIQPDISKPEEQSHNRPILPNELGEELSDKDVAGISGI